MQRGAITIYAASSSAVDSHYLDAARLTGTLIARRGLDLVCGAGLTGLMGAAIDGAVSAGGTAVGVIPRFMVDNGWNHPGLSRTIVTPDMHTRKSTMLSMARGIIALPGGVGTLEELLEAITWRQLGLWSGNIAILNTLGYYDPLLEMLRRTIDRHFMRSDHTSLWTIAATPAEALEIAAGPDSHPSPFSNKID